MMLSDLTWMEIRDLIPENPVIIQPVGSTEQHGPHLPVQVDISSSFEVAKPSATGRAASSPRRFPTATRKSGRISPAPSV